VGTVEYFPTQAVGGGGQSGLICQREGHFVAPTNIMNNLQHTHAHFVIERKQKLMNCYGAATEVAASHAGGKGKNKMKKRRRTHDGRRERGTYDTGFFAVACGAEGGEA